MNPLLYLGVFFILCLNISFNKGFQNHTQAQHPTAFSIPAQAMQHIALGYNHFAATWMWFKTIAYYGSHTDTPNYNYLAHELHTITQLNPKFEPVYYMAASVFPWGTNNTTLSRPFVMQAMIEFPKDWRWAYYRGFNTYWFDRNSELAAHYFEISAMKPHAPPLVTSLALRMHSHAGNIQTGLNFLEDLLQKKNDPKLQAQLLKQYHQLQTEQQLRAIEALLTKLPQRHQDMSDLNHLRQLGYKFPNKLADGGKIQVLKDGSLLSSQEKKRFKLFIPKKRQGVQADAAH